MEVSEHANESIQPSRIAALSARPAGTAKELEVPAGIDVEIGDGMVTVKGPLGSNVRKFNSSLLLITMQNGRIRIASSDKKSLAKKSNLTVNAFSKELENDIKGVSNYFEINMETVFLHFPVTVEVKDGRFTIKNLFGERKPRSAKIVGSTKVEIKDKSVRVYGTRLDDVSQTAANIRQACKIVNKDDRVFQDGVYYSIE
ncbi:MAG: 50S ribosomal protein L6 [Candidatus Micrarchaeaceae archaeon]